MFLVFQPQVDVKSKKVIGAEALMRWKHPKLGMVSPGKFIPIAEEMDLIVPFGEWALYAACKLNKRWQADADPVRISVNVSSKQFQKGVRIKGVISRHSKQGAKMQAARVQKARNKANRGTASVAVLRSGSRKG